MCGSRQAAIVIFLPFLPLVGLIWLTLTCRQTSSPTQQGLYQEGPGSKVVTCNKVRAFYFWERPCASTSYVQAL